MRKWYIPTRFPETLIFVTSTVGLLYQELELLIDVYKYKKYKHELQLVNLSRYLHAGSESEISKFSRITWSLPGSCHVIGTELYTTGQT